jgi:hypothetical protein
MAEHDLALRIYQAIHAALQVDEKTRDPMNALVVWTELGKGLAGKLERQGADAGLLTRLVAGYCRRGGAGRQVDLGRWAYRVAGEKRLSIPEMAAAVARVHRAIEPLLLAEWGDGGGEERQREYFLATVRGWFPVGLDIVRSLPSHRAANDVDVHAVLGAWCERYMPTDGSGPRELGVRM